MTVEIKDSAIQFDADIPSLILTDCYCRIPSHHHHPKHCENKAKRDENREIRTQFDARKY